MTDRLHALPSIEIYLRDPAGLITDCRWDGTESTPPTDAGYFALGCKLVNRLTGDTYRNTGTVASPSWDNAMAISAAELRGTAQSVTGTDDGLTTGLITAPTSFRTFVAVTSAAGSKAVTLPAASAANIGMEIWLTVGSNGFELLTPASSNNTINQVDSDGTNQLDVAANSTVICIQVSATGWLAIQVAATTITVVAPDND